MLPPCGQDAKTQLSPVSKTWTALFLPGCMLPPCGQIFKLSPFLATVRSAGKLLLWIHCMHFIGLEFTGQSKVEHNATLSQLWILFKRIFSKIAGLKHTICSCHVPFPGTKNLSSCFRPALFCTGPEKLNCRAEEVFVAFTFPWVWTSNGCNDYPHSSVKINK